MESVRLKQDDILELTVADNGMEGEGIARYGDYTIFVPFTAKGERVKAKVTHVRKDNVVFTELKEVLIPSENRVKPPCNRFMRCGGCDLMHLDYPTQLKIKRENIIRLFKKNCNADVEVEETEPSENIYGYRNKIQLPFGTVNGEVAMGFYRENSHKIVSITKCFLHGDWVEKLIGIFTDYAREFHLTAFNDVTGKGHLKHLVARYIDGNLSAVVVTNEQDLKGKEYLLKRIGEHFAHFSLYQSKKPEKTNAVMGKSLIPIREEKFEADILGVKAEINPYTFLQLNSEIRDKIYTAVAEKILSAPDPLVIDAYAGAGVLGTYLSKRGAKVYNLEIVKEATADGIKIAEKNGVKNTVTNLNGDAAVLLPELLEKITSETQTANCGNLFVILDPPRKGCDKRVIDALNTLNRDIKLIYISCNPATLTRDINLLCSYEPESVKPYDMFPQTRHVETLVVLSHKRLDGQKGE